MLGYIIFLVAVIGSIIAGYTDWKTREVPNSLSFGLIFSMLGLRVIYSLYTGDFDSLHVCLLTGGIFLGLGLVFFYTQQWGGADTKLFTALGVGFGAILPELQPLYMAMWPFMLTLILNFFIIAVAYALVYAVIMAAKEPRVGSDFRASLNQYELVIGALLFMVALVVGIYQPWLFWLTAVPVLWFLSKFLKSVEKNCMYKIVKVKEIVEFDIPEQDIMVNGKVVVNKKDPNGFTLEQIKQVQKFAKKGKLPKTLKVKWGVPLIPVFPVTIVVSVLFGDMMFVLLRLIVS